MELHPEFQKLIDKSIKDAIEKSIRPNFFDPRIIWLGALGSILAAMIIYAATQGALAINGGYHEQSCSTAEEKSK